MIPKVSGPILKIDKRDINGWFSWGVDKEGEQGKDIFIECLGENLVLWKLPGIQKDDPS